MKQMNRFVFTLVGAALVLGMAGTVLAQSKTVQGKRETISATVEAINASTRTLTMKGPKGNYVDIYVPENVQRFASIKVGDTLTARYYENMVLVLKKAGEAPTDSATDAMTKGRGAKPGATDAAQRTITATITAIDRSIPSITFTGPNNWSYSSRVQDKKALAKVNVGDRVDITWTEAVLVSFEAPKK
jgi:hypothetical protein